MYFCSPQMKIADSSLRDLLVKSFRAKRLKDILGQAIDRVL